MTSNDFFGQAKKVEKVFGLFTHIHTHNIYRYICIYSKGEIEV